MTQKHEELLLKDLCARLSYGVIVETPKGKGHVCNINLTIFEHEFGVNVNPIVRDTFSINNVKPYLFPLSSMTKEMLEELNANNFFKYRDDITNVSHIESKNGISKEIYTYIDTESVSFLTEYFHSHHIDYRGLIEKGLAIDATKLNIY